MASLSIETENVCMPTVNYTFVNNINGFHYKLMSVISEGGFGTVYKASCTINTETEIQTAVKVERWDKSLQLIEVAVLKAANNSACRHFPHLVDYGSVERQFYYIALTLLGADLHKLRKEQPKAKFSLSTAIRVGYQTMKAIEELHTKCRFICRDIKPSNFVTGLPTDGSYRRIFIVDFGLCRRFANRHNVVLPSRGEVGWRGTSRYGSLSCHMRMDLARKDDLESWFYMLVELTTGYLPWNQEKDRDVVHTMKLNARTVGRGRFLADCPSEYEQAMNKIDAMRFPDAPNYEYFYSLVKEICCARRYRKSDPYDWEPSMIKPVTAKSISFREPSALRHHNHQNMALAMVAKAFSRKTDLNNNHYDNVENAIRKRTARKTTARRSLEPLIRPPTTVTTIDDGNVDGLD